MSTCRNAELVTALNGEQHSYPRSCPTCRFGPCTRGITVPPGSMQKYAYDVLSSEPEVENKYAVIYKDTIHHPGDERSRTHPGHGYPAYDETIEKIQTFSSEADLKEWILRNNTGYSRKTFTAIRYQELKVATEVSVRLG